MTLTAGEDVMPEREANGFPRSSGAILDLGSPTTQIGGLGEYPIRVQGLQESPVSDPVNSGGDAQSQSTPGLDVGLCIPHHPAVALGRDYATEETALHVAALLLPRRRGENMGETAADAQSLELRIERGSRAAQSDENERAPKAEPFERFFDRGPQPIELQQARIFETLEPVAEVFIGHRFGPAAPQNLDFGAFPAFFDPIFGFSQRAVAAAQEPICVKSMVAFGNVEKRPVEIKNNERTTHDPEAARAGVARRAATISRRPASRATAGAQPSSRQVCEASKR